MLTSDGLYSNFWHGMTDDYYYLRTESYKLVLNRENVGCFKVPMVHSSVLINLNREESDFLTYNPLKVKDYDGPTDDIIAFAVSANKSNVQLFICNDNEFGYIMIPLEQSDSLEQDYLQLINLKLEVTTDHEPLAVDPIFNEYIKLPPKDTLTFDKIFLINLLRRPERRKRMQYCFDELGMDVEIMDAVDGR